MLNILARLKQEQVISEGDYYFARLIHEKQQPYDYPQTIQNLAVLLAALCNNSHQQGNTCLYLDPHLAHNLFGLAYRSFADNRHYLSEIKEKIDNLPIAQWQTALQNHIAFSATPLHKITPLVFQYGALYFYRVWQDEYQVAQYLKSAVENSRVLQPQPTQDIKSVLDRYFAPQEQINWQKIAVATALRQRFCLISGGPGTGKTYTVARLLAATQALRLKQRQAPLRIALTAPTGKAAARLTESIGLALAEMKLAYTLAQTIPTESVTIHRLLGVRLFEESAKFNCQNPLPIDLLVVDEASMIDLSLMAKLLQALKTQTKLILLGDKDQLASVEAGAVIGELGRFMEQGYSAELAEYLTQCTGEKLVARTEGNPIRDHLCYLRESRRFHQHSGIGHLAKMVNEMQANQSWALFEQYEDIECVAFSAEEGDDKAVYQARCLELVLQRAVQKYADYLQSIRQVLEQNQAWTQENLARIFNLFNSVRFLTALRGGNLGLDKLNQAIADRLMQKGLLSFKHSRDWYIGKPIMVNQNDSSSGLFNGDIGLYLGNSKVWFETGNGYKSVSISRVPNHEPAFALTVHKSQGSEFAHTLLVLPTENNPLLSKELIYTAVTRAKNKLTVFSNESIWKNAVKNPIKRQSGLGNLLLINNCV